jgi:hypothetical protein
VFSLETDAGVEAWASDVLGIRVAIFDSHGLEDDAGIAFGDYPVPISLTLYAGRVPAGGEQLCRAIAHVLTGVVRGGR